MTESLFANRRHGVGNRHGGYAQISKSPASDSCHSVGDDRILTTFYQFVRSCFNDSITIVTGVVINIPAFHDNGIHIAKRESILTNACHRARNRNRFQATPLKGIASYTCHRVGNGNCCKVTTDKSTITNLCHVIGNNGVFTSGDKCVRL